MHPQKPPMTGKARVHKAAADLLVSAIMNRHPVTLTPKTSAIEAMARLVKEDISGAPVCDENRVLLGFLSAKDCMLAVRGALYFSEPPQFCVADLMTSPVDTVAPQTSLIEVAERFSQRPYRMLPVTDHDRLVGVIRRHHVLKAYLDRFTALHGGKVAPSGTPRPSV